MLIDDPGGSGITIPTVWMRFYPGRTVGEASPVSETCRYEDQIVVGRCQVADGHRFGHEVGVISGGTLGSCEVDDFE